MLGLSDTKLKSELASLIDMELWTAALTDVRNHEKKEKDTCKEMIMEAKLREEEIKRANLQLENNELKASNILLKLNDTRNQADIEFKQTKSLLVSEFGNDTSVNLSKTYQNCIKEVKNWETTKIEPLYEKLHSIMSDKADSTINLSNTISSIRESLAHTKGILSSTENTIKSLQQRIKLLESQYRTLENNRMDCKKIYEIKYTNLSKTTTTIIQQKLLEFKDIKSYMEILNIVKDIYLAEYMSNKNKYEMACSSLENLEKVDIISSRNNHDNVLASKLTTDSNTNMKVTNANANGIDTDGCPTCGQPLQQAARKQRQIELINNKKAFKVNIDKLKMDSEELNNCITSFVNYETLRLETEAMKLKIDELQSQIDSEKKLLHNKQIEYNNLENELHLADIDFTTVQKKWDQDESEVQKTLKGYQDNLADMQNYITGLTKRIEQVIKTYIFAIYKYLYIKISTSYK